MSDLSYSALTDDMYRADVLSTFRSWGKEHPVVYMDDIRKKFSKFASAPRRLDAKEYLQVLTAKWALVDNSVNKLTMLHYADLAKCTLRLRDFALMVDDMLARVARVKIEHGTMVGIQAAQSISEKLQQATLNSFHFSGTKKAAQVGLVRLAELLDATNSPKVPLLQFDKHDVIDPTRFDTKTLGDITERYEVDQPTPGTSRLRLWLREEHQWATCVQTCRDFNTCDWKWDQTERLMTQIFKKTELRVARKRCFKLLNKKMVGLKHALEFVKSTNTLFFEAKTELSQAVSLGAIFDLFPEADLTKIKCNDFHFIEKTLGIEAARNYMLTEIQLVLRAEGISVNDRHVMLIVDNMCNSGSVSPNRYSSVAMQESVILKSTFERATCTFAAAAAAGIRDSLKDVSSQILLGKVPTMGVAYCHVVPVPVSVSGTTDPIDTWSPKYQDPSDDDEPETQYVPSSPNAWHEDTEMHSPMYDPQEQEQETRLMDMDVDI
jgi:DNA-directed RNA polymerase subunit A"